MRRSPLVSVVTTSYRHEPYLDDYFRSLLSQTYSNVELIFIDDGSPDGSWEKALTYEKDLRSKFSRVVMLTQPNSGMHATLQRALALATGEYVSILESDDYYLPEKIERNISYFQLNPDCGLVHSNMNLVYQDRILHNAKSMDPTSIPTGLVFERLLSIGNFISTCTTCFRMDAFRKHARLAEYARRGYLMGDYPLWLDLAQHVSFGYIPEALACYRILDESASHSRDRRRYARFNLDVHRIQLDYLKYANSRSVVSNVYSALIGHAYWTREAHLYQHSLSTYLFAAHAFPTRLLTYYQLCKLVPHYVLTRIGFRRKDLTFFEQQNRLALKSQEPFAGGSTHGS